MSGETIIIGVDPGTVITGYGIIVQGKHGLQVVDYGCIRPPASTLLSERYLIIYESLVELLQQYEPIEMAVETQFVHKNVQSALKLGMARGCAVIGAKQHKLKVYEYAPNEVKAAMTGTGKASKQQMQGAVARFLSLPKLPEPYDAADALAIAICHAHRRTNRLFNPAKEL